MPYKSEKIKLPEQYDRRVKVTAADRDRIKYLYSTGEYSQRQLAEMFGCSKSNIALMVNSKRAEAVKARRKEHRLEYQDDRETRNKRQKELRSYKNDLYKKGMI